MDEDMEDRKKVSPSLQAALQRAFKREDAKAATTPLHCSRATVHVVQDTEGPNVIMTFGGASYAGTDPQGDGGDDVFAQAPVSVMLPKAAMMQFFGLLAKTFGQKATIEVDGAKLNIEVHD